MTIKERLEHLLKSAGVSNEDQGIWLSTIHVLPFDKAEVFVYILEKLDRESVSFYNENLKKKIALKDSKDPSLLEAILREETSFLSQT